MITMVYTVLYFITSKGLNKDYRERNRNKNANKYIMYSSGKINQKGWPFNT